MITIFDLPVSPLSLCQHFSIDAAALQSQATVSFMPNSTIDTYSCSEVPLYKNLKGKMSSHCTGSPDTVNRILIVYA